MKTLIAISLSLVTLLLLAVALAQCGGCAWFDTIEKIEYRNPKDRPKLELADDKLSDKQPAFDPARVHPEPVGDWLVNLSAAVIALDVPMIKPDHEADLLALHASYAAAAAAIRKSRGGSVVLLPSVNLVDGKAKQFDDGLYAAVDTLQFRTRAVPLVQRLLAKVGATGPAASYLAAALRLGGERPAAGDEAAVRGWIARFERQGHLARPAGFYTWNETLGRCWRLMRFLQQPLEDAIEQALSAALRADAALAQEYGRFVGFFDRLSNPHRVRSLVDPPARGGEVAVFPPSSSRENELFLRIFPRGLPSGADLMGELIRRIRSGEVDLAPRKDSGWYDHQVYALETLLLPERGPEHQKLLLSKSYKQRMLEAFKALLVKRRETHLRQMAVGSGAAPLEKSQLVPRLRVEPCPSFFLRTARAYAFLETFLASALGPELQRIHGLRKGGKRVPPLGAELREMRDLFYGTYLVSCEDIGLQPALAADEPVDRPACHAQAVKWLARALDDPDLAADTRVSVPVFTDTRRGVTRIWATLGVRMARLETRFARAPKVRPKDGKGEWKDPEPWQLGPQTYLIPVDAFAEAELQGLVSLTREELRALCDRHKTRDAIVAALRAFRR